MQWLRRERCKVCNDERSVRYCLRRNKELGWKCCNNYRADGKCPEACPYAPKKDEITSLLPLAKSDSRTEFMDYLEHYLQFWIYAPIEVLSSNSPNELSQTPEGKAKLTEWLSGFSFPDSSVLTLLNNKLSLKLVIHDDNKPNIEDIANVYLDAVISQDWNTVAAYHTNNVNYTEETISYFVTQLSTHPLLKKVKTRDIINSGFTSDLKQAFVYCELNKKENWTFIFANAGEQWQLYQVIWGSLQDYYDQKNQFRQIAVAISQDNEESLYNLLKSVKDKYPLSADIQYYYGLYYGMVKRPSDAATYLLNALIIEPDWREPLFHLALLYMNQKDYLTSITYWEKLALLNPQDGDVQNNIGVCYLGLGQKDKAKAIWETALITNPKSEFLKMNLEHMNDE